ncbi:hypothetical protein QQ045_022071 [Rhodiola kirilowii]
MADLQENREVSVQQEGQLCALRDIYMNLMIWSPLNKIRDKVLKRANAWLRKNPDEYYNGKTNRSTVC